MDDLCTCPTGEWHPVRPHPELGLSVPLCRICGKEHGRPICSCGQPCPRYGRDIGVCTSDAHKTSEGWGIDSWEGTTISVFIHIGGTDGRA